MSFPKPVDSENDLPVSLAVPNWEDVTADRSIEFS